MRQVLLWVPCLLSKRSCPPIGRASSPSIFREPVLHLSFLSELALKEPDSTTKRQLLEEAESQLQLEAQVKQSQLEAQAKQSQLEAQVKQAQSQLEAQATIMQLRLKIVLKERDMAQLEVKVARAAEADARTAEFAAKGLLNVRAYFVEVEKLLRKRKLTGTRKDIWRKFILLANDEYRYQNPAAEPLDAFLKDTLVSEAQKLLRSLEDTVIFDELAEANERQVNIENQAECIADYVVSLRRRLNMYAHPQSPKEIVIVTGDVLYEVDGLFLKSLAEAVLPIRVRVLSEEDIEDASDEDEAEVQREIP